ncbi:MAG: hypothetical protein CVT49_09335 [candidate division Zixibacteria bacterium HGW-Zixibacteria-1]|nr:MAG: hypothetical protein CVT49_09335 [candidate division Zixibacteria bacterium HGW-Zixibacteria-1]
MKYLMRTYLPAVLLAVMIVVPVFAGDAGHESQFSIGSGVRALGMGGGYVGLADDASAVFWNQAALALLNEQEFNFMHAALFEGTMYDVAGYVYPHPRLGGFGVSLMRLGTEDIVKRVDWNESGDFGYYIAQMMLAYGRKMGGNIYLGSALKIVNQSMDNNSTYGVGLDISLYMPVYRELTAGLLFQDIISPRLRLQNDQETQPRNVIAGIGYRNLSLVKDFKHSINIGLEIPEERSAKLHAGMETNYADRMDFRMGYDRDNLSFGLGIILGRARFDYAYKIMDGITDSHRIGLSLKFGMSVEEKLEREIDLQNARGSYLVMDDRRKQYEYYKDRGDWYLKRDNQDSAFVFYNKALAYREGDHYVLEKIDEIKSLRLKLVEQETPVVTEEMLKRSILDGYYVQAGEMLTNKEYLAAMNIVRLARELDDTDRRFAGLERRLLADIDSSIVKLLNEAESAEKAGRLTDAISAYDKILLLSPDDVAVKELKGRVGKAVNMARLISDGVESFYLGRLTAAEQNFNNVLKLSPGNIVANEYLNRISGLRQKPSSQTELEKDEHVWKIYLNALEYYRSGEYENAIELWQEVLKYYPGNEQTLNNITQARLRLQSKE